ncbi:MAG TPA: hypothetical protein VIK94_04010 [Bacilli bacterium]
MYLVSSKLLIKILKKLCKHEHLNLKSYDLRKLKRYQCYGCDLNGKNVKSNVKDNYRIFKSFQKYDVLEIPRKFQKYLEGDFLLFVTSNDEYYLCLLKYQIDKEKSFIDEKLIDFAYLYCFGKYHFENQKIIKDKDGANVTDGGNEPLHYLFDHRDLRKYQYHTTTLKLISSILKQKLFYTIFKKPIF